MLLFIILVFHICIVTHSLYCIYIIDLYSFAVYFDADSDYPGSVQLS